MFHPLTSPDSGDVFRAVATHVNFRSVHTVAGVRRASSHAECYKKFHVAAFRTT